MQCPQCGNPVQVLPVNGVFTCDAQIINNVTAVSVGANASGTGTVSGHDDSGLFKVCGYRFQFSDLVARKEQLASVDLNHRSIEYERQSELAEIQKAGHDRLVRNSEEAHGPAEPLKAKVRSRDRRASRLCKTELSYKSPLALLLFGVAVAFGTLWWADGRGTVPSWVPRSLTNFPSLTFAAIAAVALALAAMLFARHLRLAIKARWAPLALLATIGLVGVGYLLAAQDGRANLPDFVPGQVANAQFELLVGGAVFLAAVPVSFLISRARWVQAKQARRRWIQKRPGQLERIGCGDQACSECMEGLQYLPRWANSN